MEAAVKANEVTKPRRMFDVKLIEETREAPTITANPIIKQFSGLVSRRNPISVPNCFQLSILVKIKHEQICYSVDTPIMTITLLDLSLNATVESFSSTEPDTCVAFFEPKIRDVRLAFH